MKWENRSFIEWHQTHWKGKKFYFFFLNWNKLLSLFSFIVKLKFMCFWLSFLIFFILCVVHFIGDKKKCTNQLFIFFKDFIGIAFLGIFGDLHVRTKKIRFLGNYFCIVVAQMLLGRSTLGYVFHAGTKKKRKRSGFNINRHIQYYWFCFTFRDGFQKYHNLFILHSDIIFATSINIFCACYFYFSV
jgi:hypothetical protein